MTLHVERGWSTESKKAMWLISTGMEGSSDNGGDSKIGRCEREWVTRHNGRHFKSLLRVKDTCTGLRELVQEESVERAYPAVKGCLAHAHRG